MNMTPAEQRLHRITKLQISTLANLREGVSIASQLGRPLVDVMNQTVADRLNLADEFLTMGHVLMRSRHDMSRPAIARYYYSMYHAMRAAAFQYFEGDDYENHTILSQKGVPKDYPNANITRNDLKNARLLRNEADYDQYPIVSKHFRSQARSLQSIAISFVADARSYVTSKGNTYS